MDFRDILWGIFVTITILGFCLLITLMCLAFINEMTMEKIGVKEVKCIDLEGNEFNDEYCKEVIQCGVVDQWLDRNWGGSNCK